MPLIEGLDAAVGTNGEVGSGVYSVDANGESASKRVVKVLAQMRSERLVGRVRERSQEDIRNALACRERQESVDDRSLFEP